MNDEAITALWHGVRLTPTQRRIAHYLSVNAATAGYLSAAELADRAGVSQPSVTRFATALGHDGYLGLRRQLRDIAAAENLGQGQHDQREGANRAQAALRAEAAGLIRLADSLADLTAVDRAARLLAASRPLVVLGLRAAAPLAAHFSYFARKILPDVRTITDGGSSLGDQLEQAHAAGASAMLAIVLPRYPRESVEAVAAATAIGLGVVGLTDSPVSPVDGRCAVSLVAPVGADLVFDLHAGPLSLATVLLQAICDADPGQTQDRLEAFDASAARRQLFTL
ncbi:MurR/RpiR family transcriptional regulator [Pilimelia columellifera]|uniref:MurR/RpiR family transcriptional regulator n=1 Tax=Pilimelia columellifera subsp. columellifera TaxID=706583 RepID=A0ABN3NIR0_9ACTN